MKRESTQKGQSLVEILFAIAIFTIGVVTIGYLIIDAFVSLDQSEKTQKAELLASEGIEAVKLIQDEDFTVLASGSYGLHFVERWELQSESDVHEGFTRTVEIVDIEDEIKEVIVSVAWEERGRIKELALTTRITNWEQTGGEAGRVQFDHNDTGLIASTSELVGLGVRNVDPFLAVITALNVKWEGEALLERVSIGDSVTELGDTASGEEIDVADYVLMPGAGFYLLSFDFTSHPGGDVVVSATLSDGSIKHVRIPLIP